MNLKTYELKYSNTQILKYNPYLKAHRVPCVPCSKSERYGTVRWLLIR